MKLEEIKNSKTFCFYPYLQLSTVPSGFLKPCCFYEDVLTDANDTKLKVDKNNLESVWNSDGIQKIRNKMACGDKVDGCRQCYREEEHSGTSMRMRGIREWADRGEVVEAVNATIANNGVASHSPKILELKPGNSCNLKCRMCNKFDSNQIDIELHEISKKRPWIVPEHYDRVKSRAIFESGFDTKSMSDWSQSSVFWNDVYNNSKNLERLGFAGGEPSLIPEVKKLIKHLVTTGDSKHINVYYTSNMTNLSEDLIDLAKQFRTFTFIASIDGTKSVQEYVRFPSKWPTVKENFERLKNLIDEDQFRVIANFTVQAYNICDLVDFLDWMEELDRDYPAFIQNPVSLNLLTNPDFLDIQFLPRKVKMYASRRIDEYWRRTKLQRFPDFKARLQMVQSVLNRPGPDICDLKMSDFIDFTRILDDHRNQDLRNINPFLFYSCLEDTDVDIPRSISRIKNKLQRLYVQRPVQKIWGKISRSIDG